MAKDKQANIDKLSPEAYAVTQEAATERPFLVNMMPSIKMAFTLILSVVNRYFPQQINMMPVAAGRHSHIQ